MSESNKGTTNKTPQAEYEKIGGWLMFLIVILEINLLSDFYYFSSITSGYFQASLKLNDSVFLLTYNSIVAIVIFIYSIFLFVSLLMKKQYVSKAYTCYF